MSASGTGSGTRRRIAGFTVQTRLVNVLVPTATPPANATCATNPTTCCPSGSGSGGSGSGTGSGTGSGGSVPNCTGCPDTSLPMTITGTLTGSTNPTCSCLNGSSITLTRSGSMGSYVWANTSLVCGFFNPIELKCFSGVWGLSTGISSGTCPTAPPSGYYGMTSGSCSPFAFTFTVPSCWFCATAGPTDFFTLTLTP